MSLDSPLTPSEIHKLLASDLRRETIRVLHDRAPLSQGDLVVHLAARREGPVVEDIQRGLRHIALPKLEDHGVVVCEEGYGDEDGIVEIGPTFERVRAGMDGLELVDQLYRHGDEGNGGEQA